MYVAGSPYLAAGSTSSGKTRAEHEPLSSGWGLAQTLLVLGAKFFVELAVGYSGAYFIIVSGGTSDVVLNCLAAEFISDIDENIYKHFSSSFAKSLVESAPRMPPGDADCGVLFSKVTAGVKWSFFLSAFYITHKAYYWLPYCHEEDN
ncbi:unnamed protein product [Symbiodinium necroappetens]|uniref:Uncharacterized protein n=1 Tax=Symbiodinium necroappetens TaxID=1628268 RepID=A0A813C6R9_9DINO|nr:unnamed protein product [Symbiodinium necroappetens]